jgi:hypothetical protein
MGTDGSQRLPAGERRAMTRLARLLRSVVSAGGVGAENCMALTCFYGNALMLAGDKPFCLFAMSHSLALFGQGAASLICHSCFA